MQTSRRNFVKTGALAAIGAAIMPHPVFGSMKPRAMVGIQLYSIREDMTNDPVGTLKELAKMGYVYLEHANYIDRKFYGFSPQDFRKLLDDLGMQMPSGHTVMGKHHWDDGKNDFSDSWKYTVEDAAVLGQRWVISPSMDNSMRSKYEDFRKYMDVFNKCGELCNRLGMKFGYHNHDFEFSEKLNGEKLFDIMMKSLDPSLVAMQLDTGNLYNGGGIAVDVMNQYPGRFEIIHVKDEIESTSGHEKYESALLGSGIVNIQKVLELASTVGGTACYIIEQESYQDKTPLECARINLETMKNWGY